MTFILWLVIGGVLGWLASIVMKTNAQQGMILNIVVGIVGAFIGALIFYRGDMQQPVKLESFIVALLGAMLLLALINLFRRGSVR